MQQNSKLTDLFNLPIDEAEDSEEEPSVNPVLNLEAISNLEKIDHALPAVQGLEASDAEMDELAALAQSSYKDLIDLGMNVEARWSSEIFSTASTFLGHAITAKNAKINKKIKMIELQLKKAKLDQDDGGPMESASGTVLDRNDLHKEILRQIEENKKS